MRRAPAGRTTGMTGELESSIVDKTLHDKPIAATHWSTRRLAAQLGGADDVPRSCGTCMASLLLLSTSKTNGAEIDDVGFAFGAKSNLKDLSCKDKPSKVASPMLLQS